MKFLLPVALLASAVAAQTTECAAETIVQTCLATTTQVFNDCGTNDWDCKCAAQQAIVTCYNNCPGDARQEQAKGQQSIFCGYASQFPSTTRSAPSNTAAATNTAATTTSGNGQGTATGTGAGASKTNAAADLVVGAGGVLAGVAAVMAAVL